MSCYVVPPETINRIVTYICEEHMQYDRKPLTKLGYLLPLPEAAKKLAQDMLELNVRSFNCRYPEEDRKAGKIKFKEVRCDNHYQNYQMLMTFQNFLYQSCEGKCDEESLYLALDYIGGKIAYNIVKGLPEYQACTWG